MELDPKLKVTVENAAKEYDSKIVLDLSRAMALECFVKGENVYLNSGLDLDTSTVGVIGGLLSGEKAVVYVSYRKLQSKSLCLKLKASPADVEVIENSSEWLKEEAKHDRLKSFVPCKTTYLMVTYPELLDMPEYVDLLQVLKETGQLATIVFDDLHLLYEEGAEKAKIYHQSLARFKILTNYKKVKCILLSSYLNTSELTDEFLNLLGLYCIEVFDRQLGMNDVLTSTIHIDDRKTGARTKAIANSVKTSLGERSLIYCLEDDGTIEAMAKALDKVKVPYAICRETMDVPLQIDAFEKLNAYEVRVVITTLKLVGGISLTGCVDTVYHLFHPVSLNELLFGFPKALKDSRIKPKRCIIVSRPETDELMLQLRKFPGTMEEWKVFKQEMLHIIDMLKRDDICRSGLISQHCQSRKLPFDFCNRQYKCQYCEKEEEGRKNWAELHGEWERLSILKFAFDKQIISKSKDTEKV